MSETKKAPYIVRGMAIKHGDTLYAEGERIELTDDEAVQLKRWIEPVNADPVAPEGNSQPVAKSGTKAAGGKASTDDKKDTPQ